MLENSIALITQAHLGLMQFMEKVLHQGSSQIRTLRIKIRSQKFIDRKKSDYTQKTAHYEL